MLDGSYAIRASSCSRPRVAWEQPRELSEKSPLALVEGRRSGNSPGHGSVDSQSCGVGVAESSRRDWVHWLALPTKRGVQSERVPPRMGVGERKRRKRRSSLCTVSFILI